MKIFYRIVGNALGASITSTLVWFSFSIWVYLQTQSVLVTSILTGSYMVAVLGSGFLFGSIVDHHKKHTVMLWSDIISGVLFGGAFLLYVSFPHTAFTNPSDIRLWLFTIPVFLGVIIGNIRTIALSTLTTFLVPEDKRDRANGIIGTTMGIAYLISPMFGGFLIALSGLYWVLIVALLLRALTIIHLLTISVSETVTPHEEKKKGFDIKETFRVISSIPGLFGLLFFNSINNFLGGVFQPLIDPYGLSLVDQKTWGVVNGLLSIGFIAGGIWIAKKGLGKNPLRTMFIANIGMWIGCILFTIQPSIILFFLGAFNYFFLIPFIEASEQTIIQKVVPKMRQGRVFGLAQSIESAASPLSTFATGPIAQFIFIPFMTTGAGAQIIGHWYGVGAGRGIALVFSTAGIIGLLITIIAMKTRAYAHLSERYMHGTH